MANVVMLDDLLQGHPAGSSADSTGAELWCGEEWGLLRANTETSRTEKGPAKRGRVFRGVLSGRVSVLTEMCYDCAGYYNSQGCIGHSRGDCCSEKLRFEI